MSAVITATTIVIIIATAVIGTCVFAVAVAVAVTTPVVRYLVFLVVTLPESLVSVGLKRFKKLYFLFV